MRTNKKPAVILLGRQFKISLNNADAPENGFCNQCGKKYLKGKSYCHYCLNGSSPIKNSKLLVQLFVGITFLIGLVLILLV